MRARYCAGFLRRSVIFSTRAFTRYYCAITACAYSEAIRARDLRVRLKVTQHFISNMVRVGLVAATVNRLFNSINLCAIDVGRLRDVTL